MRVLTFPWIFVFVLYRNSAVMVSQVLATIMSASTYKVFVNNE